MTDNTKLIAKVTGVKVRFMRPPYGSHNSATDAVAKKLGQAVVNWSAGALDWQYNTPAKIVDVTLPQIAPGAIVLAHDIHPWTIEAVPTLIKKLRAKGYTLVSLDDILRNPRAGNTYSRGLH
jgi:peptidoglycan/xylan/chitin deacetylase (PgdA/CDA1 family)